ncbi:MAG: DUF6338 family protein [Bacillota bacterium]|nr:DUF6338 family protein [Bacillota bacterium]
MEWLGLLQYLSLLLVYVVPGYIAMEVKNFLLPTRKKETFSRFLESVLLSYVILGIFETFWHLFRHDSTYSFSISADFRYGLLLVFLGVIFGFILALLIKSHFTQKFLQLIGVTTNYYPSLWNEQLDGTVRKKKTFIGKNDDYIFVRVYLDNERVIYDGFLNAYDSDPNNQERNIYLIGYRCFSYDGDEIANNYGNWKTGVLIKGDRISRLEFMELEN